MPHRASFVLFVCLSILVTCSPSTVPPPAAPAAPPLEAEGPADAEPVVPDASPEAAPGSPIARLEPVPDAASRDRTLAELRTALALQRDGDPAAALRVLDAVAATVPAFRDWAQLLAADAAAELGDAAEVERRLAAAEPARSREWGWRARERAHRVAGDLPAAARALAEAAPDIADGGRRAQALQSLGQLRAEQGDAAGALAAYRGAMEAAPQAQAARDAAAALVGLPLTPEDRRLEGRVWLRHGNVDRGVAALNAYLASGAVDGPARAEIQLQIGRALFNARRYAEAERHLSAAVRAPDAPHGVAAEAWLLTGRAQFRDGRGDVARATLRETAERFAREDAGARALFILGDLAHDAGQLTTAREYYRRAAETGSSASEAALAAVRLGILLMHAGDARGAATALERFAEDRAADRFTAQARYWAGRAYEAAGERAPARAQFEQARTADPVSYYGSLAGERLGGTLADLPLASAPTIGETTSRAVDVALFRVDLLRELPLEEAAAFEMEMARRELDAHAGALYLLAEAHLQRDAPVAGILLGREIQRAEGAWNPRLLRIVYPFPHRPLIETEARRHGLDPFMVAGLIRQESMFNPNAVSPAGAIGLMQVMPATGRSLAQRAGIAGFDASRLRDPAVNVRLGTLFLADQLRRWEHRSAAFAAYNAGPSRVSRWRELPEFRDEELFAERIPIAETRDYVKILNFNARLYRALYGG